MKNDVLCKTAPQGRNDSLASSRQACGNRLVAGKLLAVALAIALGTAPCAASAQDTAVQITLAAQPLGQALLQLGRETSLQIFYAQDLVRGLQAPPVSGTLTPEAAGFSRALVRDVDGSRYNPYRPQNLAHLFTTHLVPGTSSKLTVGGGVQWRSGVYYARTLNGAQARVEQGSVLLASLVAHYRFTPNLSTQLNVSNLFDSAMST